ncbi:ATPase domain-containing protein [Terriglobus roseus]|uniref:non-specific serine/threonine protein kinase n=1 Tax=Terriglobus roseus TaxID=392734 RepID=A0A1H4TVM1_9BACT|nr:ATPase domain-containing protein [Terriglobus roseus]SEC60459.1 circadian clock protein KaiC [Terriglobus roseus]
MSSSFELKRLDTGINGLDDILSGGLPAGQMYLLEGDPGTGKTTLAMQFILEGTRRGEKCLYITLSEPRSELELSMRSHGWDPADLPIAEFVPEEASLSAEQQYTVFHPSEVELAGTVEKLVSTLDDLQPDRLVVDSLSELRLLASDSMRYRRQLLALKQYFAGKSTTVLLLDDLTGNGRDLQLHSIAHGVIRLEKISRSYGATRRQIEIVKLRGSGYREGFHDYVIQRGGVMIFPRLIAAEHSESFEGERIASGLTELDAMFGGGIARGSSTLFTGPPGSGKSTVAMQFAFAAAARGQRSIFYTFDEVLRTAKDRARALGMDIDRELERGTLSMSQVDPAELSPGEFIHQIRSDVDEKGTRVVVIDSLNGLMNSMPGERDLVMHLHELLAYLNQKGVVTLMVLAQQGLVGTMHAQVDVSYLADTVVLLRYFESKGAIRQVICVLKQRVGAHERTLRELVFGSNAIEVGEPLVNFQGILTGVPQMLGGTEAGVDENAPHPEGGATSMFGAFASHDAL